MVLISGSNHLQHLSYGPLVWAPILDPNMYQLYTIYQIGAHRRDPTRIKGAHNNELRAEQRP